jgi:thiol-disulfide isomerase/thioredoxin
MKRIIITLSFFLQFYYCLASEQLFLKGNIKSLSKVTISLKDLNGKLMAQSVLQKQSETFAFEPLTIIPDLYILSIGKTAQKVFLTNRTVTINGYYDDVDPQNSNLDFTGLEEHLEMMKYIPKKIKDRIDSNAYNKLSGSQLAALSYLVKIDNYDYSKTFIDKISATELKSLSGKILIKKADSLKYFITGIDAPGFSLPNEQNKIVSLTDFKGRIVVLDFWASWCLPCRREMEVFKSFYKDFEDNVQFISISLDEDPIKYKAALREMNIPWLKVWDKSGFGKSTLQARYGFKAIPFCVVIDAKGKVFRRNIINGVELKKALIEITKNKEI